jgi:hypothetical protein
LLCIAEVMTDWREFGGLQVLLQLEQTAEPIPCVVRWIPEADKVYV